MQKPRLAAYIIVFDGKMRTLTPINATVPRQVAFTSVSKEPVSYWCVLIFLKMCLKCQIIACFHIQRCSRTDSPPSRCVKPLYWTMFYQHFTMHCFYQFVLMSSIFTRILSLAHLFYAYFTHGPNKSASAQYDNTRGAWLTQEGCTITERKEGRKWNEGIKCWERKETK